MKSERIFPTELNLEVSPSHLGNQRGRFMRNMDYVQSGSDKNTLQLTPNQSNELYDPTFSLPPGINQTIGTGVSRETNTEYTMLWNSLGNHQLYLMRNGTCQTIYKDPLLKFVLDPQHFIKGDGRISIHRVCIGTENKTFIIFTDGINRQRFICEEDSIATDSFNPVKFPRFAGDYYDREDLISLGVVPATDCIEIKPIASDPRKLNKLKFNPWRFRIMYIDVYGRQSEHGNISDLYYQSDCSGNAGCLDLTFSAGGPLVQKIVVEYQKGCHAEWSKHETIDKYSECDKPWYEQVLNTKNKYNPVTNRITYRFCADKGCVAVPDVETQRYENPLPRFSESAFPMAGVLGLAGNTYGFPKFGCDLLDKIHFEVEKPTEEAEQLIQTRDITVWAMIYNPFREYVEAIWEKNDRIVFGGLAEGSKDEPDVIDTYKQYFGDKDQAGFIGYLAGTGYAVVSKQYRFPRPDLFNPTAPRDLELVEQPVAPSAAEVRDHYWLQKFEFKGLPPGNYVFRIAGHHAKLSDANYQATSTYVIGIGGYYESGPFQGRFRGLVDNNDKEILINVCDKDYDSIKDDKKGLIISDLTYPHTDISLRNRSRITQGYAFEDIHGERGVQPIVNARINSNGSDRKGSTWTDHNGFFFMAARDKDFYTEIWTMRKCKWQKMVRLEERQDKVDLFGTAAEYVHGWVARPGLHVQDVYATRIWDSFDEEKCNRTLIRGKVVDCKTKAGISGITVGITQAGFTTTNALGEYELVVHDTDHVANQKIIFLPTGTCATKLCNNQKCAPVINYYPTNCVICEERVFVPITLEYELITQNRGLQKGGTYPFAVSGGDWLDRKGLAQIKPEWYLNMPTVNEAKSFAYSRIKWTIDANAVFPSWMKTLYIRFGRNLAFDDFLEWVVDRFEFVDNTGNINTAAPTQIKIYYDSLNEYNKQNNFSTNATWQFLDEKGKHITTDVVQFIANGNGDIFDTVITSLVRADKDGKYFLVDYTPALRELEEGALIKFIRPSTCVDANLYFAVCETVKINNGIPERTTGYVNAFDSYMVGRQIPTPVVTIKKEERTVPGSTNPVIVEEIEVSETTNVLKPYVWQFEHHSPSDFWGTKCNNRGMPVPEFDGENIICKKTEIALSGSLGVNGLVNYLHYFDEKRKKLLEVNDGGIVACIAPGANFVKVIFEVGSCMLPYDDNAVRYDESGKAIILSAEKQFGKPQNRSPYGCQKNDRNSITTFDGGVSWIDSTNVGHIVDDYRNTVDISADKYESFLRQKIKYIQNFNKTHTLKKYFHQQFNPRDRGLYITDFSLASKSFITDDFSEQIEKNETLVVNLDTKALRKFCSFTGEYYGALPGDDREKQFYSFKEGIPYIHHHQNTTSVNKFFGVQCQRSLRFAISLDLFTTKKYLGLQVYVDNIVMYSPEIKTQFGQVSLIPRNWFKRGDKYWIAPFLCEKENIFDGELLRGRWAEVLLVGDPDNLDKYSELTGIIVTANE